jgi:hypothetical protein
VVAFASMSGAAQAAPHWFACEKLTTETGKFTDSECEKSGKGFWEWEKLPETPKTQVVTFGKLALATAAGTITCKVLDGGNAWNTVADGLDEVLAFTNYECSISPAAECTEGLELIAEKFPWSTKLVTGPPIRDEITGVNIRFKCTKPVARNLLFTGTLKPKFVLGHPSFFEFDSESGELTNAEAGKATVSGKDFIETDEGREVKAE